LSHTCKHANRRLVWADKNAYGQTFEKRQLREQCLDCGWLLGERKSHALADSTTPNADEFAMKRCLEERNRSFLKQCQERQRIYIAEREREDAAWWARYDDHLASNKWQRMRRIIFARDNETCQGCLSRPATQVHHLTYRNVCEEFAFQLISICDICHQRFHEKK
jgi:5-methylcytosine-specific restriction endonuclease McrA